MFLRVMQIQLLFVVFALGLPVSSLAETEYEKGWDNFKAGNYSLARKIWLPLAERGDGDAALGLAIIFENGLQTARDPARATRWYRVAADKGIAEAQHDLGIKYFTGATVKKDLKQTYSLWKQAAETGLGSAQSKLAYLYLQGMGTRKNPAEAIRWYRQAANQGNTEAMYNLAIIYKQGNYVEPNIHQYNYWLQQAAEADYAPAQYDLGLMLLYGKDMERSVTNGKMWLIKAANNGHAESQYYLGTLYMNGHIIRPDKDKALELLRAAAQQGHKGAKQSLVDMKYLQVDRSQPGGAVSRAFGSSPTTARSSASSQSLQENDSVVLGSSPQQRPVPATDFSSSADDRTGWLANQPAESYTIQLLASKNRDSVIRYLEQLPDHMDAYYYRYVRNNQDWTAVAFGLFESRNLATRAINQLPENLRKNKPWIRKISALHNVLAD